jgi:hypothetical protein
MTDLAIAPAQPPQTAPRQIANAVAAWLSRLSAVRSVNRTACPAASELAGITRLDRYDVAPWLSF